MLSEMPTFRNQKWVKCELIFSEKALGALYVGLNIIPEGLIWGPNS